MLVTTNTHGGPVMSYKHLTIEDRSKIEVLYHQDYTASQIAQAIGRNRRRFIMNLNQFNQLVMMPN